MTIDKETQEPETPHRDRRRLLPSNLLFAICYFLSRNSKKFLKRPPDMQVLQSDFLPCDLCSQLGYGVA